LQKRESFVCNTHLKSIDNNKPILEDHPILREYTDVFPEEVPGLPPRRDINFSIELVPGAVPVSRTLYRMSTPELVELKHSAQCVSMGSTNLVCEKEGFHTQVVHRL
jgi:hypothetical protein